MNRFYSCVLLKQILGISLLITFAILFFPKHTYAAMITWSIVPEESSLSFTGTQNDAPLTGKFKKFSGDIQFNPNELAASHVKITVDTGSISFSYKDIEDTLKAADWFNVKAFPIALFEAKDFIKIGADHYQARGTLTIRDKTLPIIVDFIKTTGTNNKVKIKGTAILKRTAFGIGTGEWSSIEEVKDDVKINFILTVVKK